MAIEDLDGLPARGRLVIETASMGLVTHHRDFSALDRSPEQIAVFS